MHYERRVAERIAEREILVSDEAELDILLDKTSFNPCEAIERRELFQEIMEIVRNELSKEERQMIIEVFLNGKKRKEAATSMGLTYRQLTYRLDNAIKKVRKIYSENK